MSRVSERRSMALTLDTLPKQRRYLFIFSLITGLVALQMLYLALDDMTMNLWLTVALCAGFAYSYFLEQRQRVFTEYWVSIFAIGVSLNYYFQIQSKPEYLGNFLGIMAGILIVLLAFKAFAPADHRFMLLLETVVLIFSAVASFDLKYMLLLPMYLLAAGSTLYVASQCEIVARVAESSPDVSRLHVVTVGRSFYKVLWRAVGGLLLLSVIAYTVTPHASRSDRGLIFSAAPTVDEVSGQQQQSRSQQAMSQIDTGESTVGIGNDFDLTDGSKLSSKAIPVLSVKSHRNGYLRAQVYDYYVGTGWLRSRAMEHLEPLKPNLNISPLTANSSDVYAHPNSYKVQLYDFPSEVARDRMNNGSGESNDLEIDPDNQYSIDAKLDLQYERIRQEVKLLEPQPPIYFSMYQPSQLLNVSLASGSGRRLDVPQVDMASAIRPDPALKPNDHPKNFSYTVISLEPRYSPQDLQEVAFSGPKPIVSQYTQLPLNSNAPSERDRPEKFNAEKWRPISPRLKNLAASIVNEARKSDKPLTQYQKVSAIYDYLTDSSEFHYSRDKQQIDSTKEQTEAFVLGKQEGYCRQFSSAMAVLCRLNGVPSRVVTGFAPGSYSLVDNAYIYKASDAHAWVEVYFDGYGWIPFDPSPTSGDLFNKSDLMRMVTGATDFLSQLFVLDPAATQKMILESLQHMWKSIISYGPAAVLFITMSFLLLIIGVYVARMPRHKKIAPLTPENSVVNAYLVVRSSFGQLGMKQGDGQTARSYLVDVAAQAEPLRPALIDFVPLYEQAAFAPATLEDGADAQAKTLVSQVQTWVRDEITRRRRSRGKHSD
jgi:hypothetical protein